MEIISFLGMGREGAVFKVRAEQKVQVGKFYRNALDYSDIELIRQLNSIQFKGLFNLEISNTHSIKYDFVELYPLKVDLEEMEGVLKFIKIFYSKSGLFYTDIDPRRNNIMKTGDHEYYFVDYFNAFIIGSKSLCFWYKMNVVNTVFGIKNSFFFTNQGLMNKAQKKGFRYCYIIMKTLVGSLFMKFPIFAFRYSLDEFIDEVIQWSKNQSK